jgi:ATP synthase protein I
MPERSRDDEFDDAFETHVARQSERIEKGKAQREDKSFWRYLGLFGSVGWSIVIPMLIGGLLGRWIDAGSGGGHFWSISLLALGTLVGALNGWRVVEKDMRDEEK